METRTEAAFRQEGSEERSLSESGVRTRRRRGIRLYHTVWRNVGDMFFDQDRLGSWQQWEHKFDSQINSVDDAMARVDTMLKSLKDNYTWLERPSKDGDSDLNDSFGGIGVIWKQKRGAFIVGSVMPDTPAREAGLRKGDVLQSVGRKESISFEDVDALASAIRGKVGTNVRITVMRGEEPHSFTITRAKINEHAVSTRLLNGGIGYVRLEYFSQTTTVNQMKRALRGDLKNCRALVLDLRGNPGGITSNAIDLASLFIRTGKIVTTEERIYRSTETRTTEISVTGNAIVKRIRNTHGERLVRLPRKHPCLVKRNIPLVVLTDKGSASSSELLAGCLRDNGRAVLIGENTFGKGIGQTTKWMPNNASLVVTTFHYYNPSGHWPGDANRQKIGLKPDFNVKGGGRIWRSSLKRDKQLQFALEFLGGELGSLTT